MTTFKTLSDDSWLVVDDEKSIGVLNQTHQKFAFVGNDIKITFNTSSDVKDYFGKKPLNGEDIVEIDSEKQIFVKGYPINYTKPIIIDSADYDTDIPIFSKTVKMDVIYCAGYFAIHFEKGWAKTFCPKLLTIGKYKTLGPYKTQEDLNKELQKHK